MMKLNVCDVILVLVCHTFGLSILQQHQSLYLLELQSYHASKSASKSNYINYLMVEFCRSCLCSLGPRLHSLPLNFSFNFLQWRSQAQAQAMFDCAWAICLENMSSKVH